MLVNDGSPDNSAAVCRGLVHDAGLPVTYIEHSRNFGEHNAVMTGLGQGPDAARLDQDAPGIGPEAEAARGFGHGPNRMASGWRISGTFIKTGSDITGTTGNNC